MKHEIHEVKTSVTDTDITFEQIYEKSYIPTEYIEDIKRANVLIIPEENFRDEGDVLFPEMTSEFYDFLKESADEGIVADIAISDENFQKIEMHSATINIPKIIVEYIILPIIPGVISSFLHDLLKKLRRNPEEATAKVKIVSEDTASKKSKMIEYEGPVSGIKEALTEASKNLFAGQDDDK